MKLRLFGASTARDILEITFGPSQCDLRVSQDAAIFQGVRMATSK